MLADADLDQVLQYRNMRGDVQRRRLSHLLLHLFNHQAHHRGQATTLFSQCGLDVGVTDLLGAARQMIERLGYVGGDSHAIEIYCAVLFLFFLVCYPLTRLAGYLERRLRV